jgi:hypothetical protein
MKKIVIILMLSLLSVGAYSQDTIKVPVRIARQIVVDLVRGDSAVAVLKLTKEQLDSTEKKVKYLDSTIQVYKLKDTMCLSTVRNEQSKFQIQGQYVGSLEKSVKDLKTERIITRIILGIALVLFSIYK